MARRKAQTYGVRNLADCGGRLSARHMRSSSEAVAHAICGVGRRRAALHIGVLRISLRRGAHIQAVSQLLAGSRWTRAEPRHRPGAHACVA
jgi:hypothetical protein